MFCLLVLPVPWISQNMLVLTELILHVCFQWRRLFLIIFMKHNPRTQHSLACLFISGARAQWASRKKHWEEWSEKASKVEMLPPMLQPECHPVLQNPQEGSRNLSRSHSWDIYRWHEKQNETNSSNIHFGFAFVSMLIQKKILRSRAQSEQVTPECLFAFAFVIFWRSLIRKSFCFASL